MIREFRQVLAELEMLSHGTTQRIGFSTAGGSNDAEGPVGGDKHPPHVVFRVRWECCYSDEGRRAVLRAAEDELSRWKGRTKREPQKRRETAEERRDALIRDGEGMDPYKASIRFDMTAQQVRDARKADQRYIEDGRPNDKLKQARLLANSGVPLRSIQMQTGIPKSTIHRLCGDKNTRKAA